MVAQIAGMIMVNIGIILLFDFLVIATGFIIDIFRIKHDPEWVYLGVAIAVIATIFLPILSIIIWGLWLMS